MEGTAYADVSVPFYAPTDKEEGEERASEVEGCSYNMENGKYVKTPMKRESISFERIDNRYKILKFSLPAVKEGTIIEYHYKLYSDYFIHIDNWMMQEELPMLYNQYKITIPNVFIYNIELRGKDYIQMKQKESALHARHVKGWNGRNQQRFHYPGTRNDIHFSEPPSYPSGRTLLLVSGRLKSTNKF